MGPERRERRLSRLRRDDGEQLALVGGVERIEAQHRAGRGHAPPHGYAALVELDAQARALRELAERRRDAAARGIAQHAHLGPGLEQRPDEGTQRRAVALNLAAEHTAARKHDRRAVVARRAGEYDRVARPHGRGREARIPHKPYPGGVYIEPVSPAALDDLGVAGDYAHAGGLSRLRRGG